MEEIFKTLGVFVAGLGGSGVIFLGLSSWIGKIWATKMMEKEKIKLTKDLESYKNDLDKSNYATRIQYDKEFSIYLEIWAALSECVNSTLDLFPPVEFTPPGAEELYEYYTEKWRKFVKNYNEFSTVINKYSPFYDELFYADFLKLKNLCFSQGSIFKLFKLGKIGGTSSIDHKKVYEETPKAINELVDSLRKESKEYLRNQKVIDN